MKRKALGRGLEALIPVREKKAQKESPGGEELSLIEVERITSNPHQPRRKFDAEKLEELTASIRKKGVIQPVIVRDVGGKYELIAGERRLRAAKEAGVLRVPAIVRNVVDKEAVELSLIENLQRDDLSPIDEAVCYAELMGRFGVTQEALADELGKNRSSLANTVRLLKLPDEVKNELERGKISRGHALALLSLGDKAEQISLCRKIIREGLSVRRTEQLVKAGVRISTRKGASLLKPQEIISLEEELQRFLGTRINITRKKRGGSIEIYYYSDEDLERILSIIKIEAA